MTQTTDIEQQIIQLDSQRMQAMINADVDALKPILADDMTYVHTTTALDTKQSLLDALGSGTLNYQSMVTDDVKVRVYGDTAIVTGAAKIQVISRGQPNTFGVRFTDVYTNRDGRWQMVAWQATRVPE